MSPDVIDRLRSGIGPKRRDRKNHWVILLISFLLAIILWVFVSLSSNSFETDIVVPLKLVDVPEDVRLSVDPPKSITIRTRGRGLQLLSAISKLNPDTLEISFQRHAERGFYATSSHLRDFEDLFPPGLELQYSEPDTIYLDHVLKTSKTVPVESMVKVKLASSYRLLNPPIVKPDSVKVVGEPELLANISSWKTQSVETPLLNEETFLKIPMDTNSNFRIDPAWVEMHFTPKVYTENKQRIQLTVENIPSDAEIQLEQTEVELNYLVPLDEFGNYTEKDFEIRVDFGRITSRSKYLLPYLYKAPPHVQLNSIVPDKVNFTMIKKQ